MNCGGSIANYNGKQFEEKTNNKLVLIENGYIINSFSKKPKNKYDFYLSKLYDDKIITFTMQNGFRIYMKNKYNINLFRSPDEAYIIEYNNGKKIIKILEKKEQNVEGSVETKIWSGPSFKREYEIILGIEFEVYYGYCVNNFLKNKLLSSDIKYKTLNIILNENNIETLYGDDDNYFTKLDIWVNNF